MPNENQNQEPTLEGFVPEQETPVEETPPVEGGAEEQAVVEETPEQPDSSQKAVAEQAQPQKTPEQIDEDRKHWQTEAQSLKAQLKDIQSKYSEPEKPVSEAAPKPVAANERDFSTALNQLSDDELREQLRNDPILQMQLNRYNTQQLLSTMLDEREQKAEARARYAAEAADANKSVEAFCVRNNIPMERAREIKASLESAGIQARPSTMAELIGDRLVMELVAGNVQKVAAVAAAKAARAAKTQPLTTQPDGGGPAANTGGEKSIEERLADKFKPDKGKEAINRLFS